MSSYFIGALFPKPTAIFPCVFQIAKLESNAVIVLRCISFQCHCELFIASCRRQLRKRTSHEFEFSMIVGGYHALRDHAAEGLHRGTRCWRKFDSDSVLMVQQLLWLVLAWLIARLVVCLLGSLVVCLLGCFLGPA